MILDINFTPYIPTTIIGLLGLIFIYLYFLFKNRDDNKVKKLKAVKSEDRARVIQMELNDSGIHVDSGSLTNDQKFKLLISILQSKTRKYLIIAITLILLAIIVAILLYFDKPYKNEFDRTDVGLDTISQSDKGDVSGKIQTPIRDTSTRNKEISNSNKDTQINVIPAPKVTRDKKNNSVQLSTEKMSDMEFDNRMSYIVGRYLLNKTFGGPFYKAEGKLIVKRESQDAISVSGYYLFMPKLEMKLDVKFNSGLIKITKNQMSSNSFEISIEGEGTATDPRYKNGMIFNVKIPKFTYNHINRALDCDNFYIDNDAYFFENSRALFLAPKPVVVTKPVR